MNRVKTLKHYFSKRLGTSTEEKMKIYLFRYLGYNTKNDIVNPKIIKPKKTEQRIIFRGTLQGFKSMNNLTDQIMLYLFIHRMLPVSREVFT